MPISRIFTVFLGTVLFLTIFSATTCADDSRYLAVFANGERSAGQRISGWHVANGTPKLEQTELRGESRSLRWFRDRSLDRSEQFQGTEGAVQFVGGDRLPGRVIAFVEATDDGTSAHLLVQTDRPMSHPTSEPNDFLVRVQLEFVRGIDWGMESSGTH